jgi:hypothetical protein
MRLLRVAVGLGLLVAASGIAVAEDAFGAPKKEELEMTSVPGYPGVSAVVLYSREITRDGDRTVEHYERIKVLTDEGKKYANVELGYVSFSFSFFNHNAMYATSIEKIEARTIHSDGTIVPFTGEPYVETRKQVKGAKAQAKVFTLPDVQVGSILEYRYLIKSAALDLPEWDIQGDLYVKQADYAWFRTGGLVVDEHHKALTTVSYYPLLPAGAKVEQDRRDYSLTVKDVPPVPEEDFMPPEESFRYRVVFNFTRFKTNDDFWKEEGKDWSKEENKFIGSADSLSAATQSMIAGATTQEEKLRKIYAEVMKLENTDYTREREAREDKAEGVEKIKTVADVFSVKRGSATDLTALFVGMARAAGMSAWLMLVPDRSQVAFSPDWLSFHQFETEIAVVTLDGKDKFFDPGSRYSRYGHLAWWHTDVQGLRQTAEGTAFAKTPSEDASENVTERKAVLTMDEHGVAAGKIEISYQGAAALHWRHVGLSGDAESLRHAMQVNLEELLPKSVEVKVAGIKGLEDYEKPFVVSYEVSGPLGVAAGKRLTVLADVFRTNAEASFTQAKRDLPVSFRYNQQVQDSVEISYPAGMKVEATPTEAKLAMAGVGQYSLNVTAGDGKLMARRSNATTELQVPVSEYGALRSFATQYEEKDRESVVLKSGS